MGQESTSAINSVNMYHAGSPVLLQNLDNMDNLLNTFNLNKFTNNALKQHHRGIGFSCEMSSQLDQAYPIPSDKIQLDLRCNDNGQTVFSVIGSRDLKDLYSQDLTIANSKIGWFDQHNADLVGYLRQMAGDYLMKNGLAIESGPSVPDWMIAGLQIGRAHV